MKLTNLIELKQLKESSESNTIKDECDCDVHNQ